MTTCSVTALCGSLFFSPENYVLHLSGNAKVLNDKGRWLAGWKRNVALRKKGQGLLNTSRGTLRQVGFGISDSSVLPGRGTSTWGVHLQRVWGEAQIWKDSTGEWSKDVSKGHTKRATGSRGEWSCKAKNPWTSPPIHLPKATHTFFNHLIEIISLLCAESINDHLLPSVFKHKKTLLHFLNTISWFQHWTISEIQFLHIYLAAKLDLN